MTKPTPKPKAKKVKEIYAWAVLGNDSRQIDALYALPPTYQTDTNCCNLMIFKNRKMAKKSAGAYGNKIIKKLLITIID